MDLPRLGVFSFQDALSAAESLRFALTVERLGYGVLWVVEGGGRDAVVQAGLLLARAEKLIVASGVASVWGRAAPQMCAGARTLGEASGGRFIAGLGVNNPLSMQLRGLAYEKPVEFMRSYLEHYRASLYAAPLPREEPPVILGANRPKMLALAATAADGALTYLGPVELTARARGVLGRKWLCVTQAALLETDAAAARAGARAYLQFYLPHIDAYVRNLISLGFVERDFADGLSDRLVDALVVWGSPEGVRQRIQQHFDAGADHVCILPLAPGGGTTPDLATLGALAPG